MGVAGTVFCRDHRHDEPPHVWIEVMTEDSGLLIGEKGKNLRALEHVLRLLLKGKADDRFRFLLDINTYRLRRMDFIKKLARGAARRVIDSHHAVTLEPMPPMERRIVHTTLMEEGRVETGSIGEGGDRRVVIRPRDPLLAPVHPIHAAGQQARR